MRKIIIMALMAATALPAGAAMAQTGELRRDRQDIRQQERQLDRARANGDRGDVREQRQDVREARQEYRQDVRDHRQDRREDIRDRRGDHRDDWRSYRQSNRNVYARGNWRAPFRYNAWNVGARIQPSYYGSRYFVSDYARYRLPAPGRDLRYVRHYDDVLLVNVRTGRVVNVYRSFFL